MSFLKKLFGDRDERGALLPLYHAIVTEARQPVWYREGAVPDSLDGRFDMVAAVLTLVLLRIEAEGEPGRVPSARLAELFIDDMDGQLRQIGIGDIVVGKHIGKMMSALGGRLTAYREALTPGGDLEDALARNLYRGDTPAPTALTFTADRLRALHTALGAIPAAMLLGGAMPAA